MHPLGGMAELAAWAGKNMAYNLKFIPEDKLAWKPAPTAKSALEIINHVSLFVAGMSGFLNTGQWTTPAVTPATNLAEAQELITRVSAEYAVALRNLPVERLAETAVLPYGSFPMARAVAMPVADLVHHHGQIAYIQTILGDEAMHFYEEG